jgi:hypothetical protein
MVSRSSLLILHANTLCSRSLQRFSKFWCKPFVVVLGVDNSTWKNVVLMHVKEKLKITKREKGSDVIYIYT